AAEHELEVGARVGVLGALADGVAEPGGGRAELRESVLGLVLLELGGLGGEREAEVERRAVAELAVRPGAVARVGKALLGVLEVALGERLERRVVGPAGQLIGF